MENNTENTKKGLTEQIGKNVAENLVFDGNKATILFGEAAAQLPLRDENAVLFDGVLDSPAVWLESRSNQITGENAHLIVDRENMCMHLITEEREYFGNRVSGSLQFHQAFLKFGINQGQYITTQAMADKIKMNRAFFESKADAMALVTELKNFKATVSREIEKNNDNRGNKTDLLAQVVSSNMPERFMMVIPIFKGQQKQKIEVEVYIEPENLSCTLISPEAAEEIEHIRDSAINKVIERIVAVDDTIVILER